MTFSLPSRRGIVKSLSFKTALALNKLTRLGGPKCLYEEKVGPARRVTLPSGKGDPPRQVTLLAQPTYCFSSNGSPRFVRKCLKIWLAQGSPGWRVTPLSETTFLHINRALVCFWAQGCFGLIVPGARIRSNF